MTAMHPGFMKYHLDKSTAKDEPRIGARSLGRVKKTVIHAPNKPAGKYAMPVIAVVAAVATFVEGYAAVVAATSLTSAIVGGAMMVGAAMTVVGTVTGNEKLAKYGAILSLGASAVGAFTGALPSLAAAGDTAGLGATDALTAADAAAGGGAEFLAQNAGQPLVTGGEAASGMSAASNAASSVAAASEPILGAAAEPAASSMLTQDNSAFKFGSNAASNAIPGIQETTTFQANNSAGNGLLNWVKENPDATKVLANTAGPLLGNLVTSDKDKALIEQSRINNQMTQEQIAALRADEERKARRTANMSGKLYVPKAG